MIFDFVLITLFTYVFLFLERSSTVNVGGERAAFCSIDLCKKKQLYAPFKYRPLVFWIAILFNITSKYLKTIMIWGERYYYNIYLLESKGLEKYYLFKYALFLIMNCIFYWYLHILGLNALAGVLVLDCLVALTFIYDTLDYILEIAFYSLFLIGVLNNYSFVFFFFVAGFAALNRESAIFMIPIAAIYCNVFSVAATIVGFIIGFVIPRIIYRKRFDMNDAHYESGFKFLTFDPIRNWRRAIWPHIKRRFTGESSVPISRFFLKFEGHKTFVSDKKNKPIVAKTKEIFLNRLFLGVFFVLFVFATFLFSYSNVDVFFKPLIWIFSVFIICISLPADIREIRVYCPSFVVLVPCLIGG